MKLYYIPMACSLAVHIALRKAGVVPELVKYDPATGMAEDGISLRETYPKGYVPVVLDGQGEVLTEVLSIMIELDARYPEAGLLPKGRVQRRQAIEWLAYTSSELHKRFTVPLFFEETLTAETNAQREQIAARFDLVEASLSDKKAFLLGDELTAADCYLLVVMLWTVPAKVSLDRWPDLTAYRDRLLQNPDVSAAMAAEGLM